MKQIAPTVQVVGHIGMVLEKNRFVSNSDESNNSAVHCTFAHCFTCDTSNSSMKFSILHKVIETQRLRHS